MFPGTVGPGIVSSLSDHGKGCWRCSESKLKKCSKMNENNTYIHCHSDARQCCTVVRATQQVNRNGNFGGIRTP